jgi:hypothetical protein
MAVQGCQESSRVRWGEEMGRGGEERRRRELGRKKIYKKQCM